MENTIRKVNEDVMNGMVNPLEAYVQLKRIEAALKDTLKAVQPEAIEELEKHGKGEHTLYDAKVQVKNAAGRWSFKGIKKWELMKEEIAGYEAAMKSAYKAAEAGGAWIDPDTGEIAELPEYTQGATTISVRL